MMFTEQLGWFKCAWQGSRKKISATQYAVACTYHNGFKYTLKCIWKTIRHTEKNSNSSFQFILFLLILTRSEQKQDSIC